MTFPSRNRRAVQWSLGQCRDDHPGLSDLGLYVATGQRRLGKSESGCVSELGAFADIISPQPVASEAIPWSRIRCVPMVRAGNT